MFEIVRRHAPLFIAVGAVAALTATPVVAQLGDDPELGPSIVRNADKVDGRHAIGAVTNRSRRAGKLVATNKFGRFPSNIVSISWDELKNVPASLKDGDDVGYFSGLAYDSTDCGGASCDPLVSDGDEWIVSSEWPSDMQVMWSAIPTNKSPGTEWLNTYVEIERLENGRLEYWVNMFNSSGSQATHYKLRYVAFDMGVPPVDAARQSRSDVRKETKAVRSRRTPR